MAKVETNDHITVYMANRIAIYTAIWSTCNCLFLGTEIQALRMYIYEYTGMFVNCVCSSPWRVICDFHRARRVSPLWEDPLRFEDFCPKL